MRPRRTLHSSSLYEAGSCGGLRTTFARTSQRGAQRKGSAKRSVCCAKHGKPYVQRSTALTWRPECETKEGVRSATFVQVLRPSRYTRALFCTARRCRCRLLRHRSQCCAFLPRLFLLLVAEAAAVAAAATASCPQKSLEGARGVS